MLSATSPIPHICISPASPVPYFPFPSQRTCLDDGEYRMGLLTPQRYFPDMFPRHSSPLRPADCPPPRGLQRDPFHLLLEVSRDRRAALGLRKVPDLRKELAIKNQRNKHFERRVHFLSETLEPPSPTKVSTLKSPLESFTFLNHTLPSLGLQPPLIPLSSLAKKRDGRHTWFEQVDHRLPIGNHRIDLKTDRRKYPSLEEIIARIGPVHPPPSMAKDPILTTSRPSMFLRSNKNAWTTRSVSDTRPDINIGRLHMPIRRRQSSNSLPDLGLTAMASRPCSPNIDITAAVLPRARTNARYPLMEFNVGRANTAREMMTTIKRRTSPPPGLTHDPDYLVKLKRHSAPAETHFRGRFGFEHPNLLLPGAF